MSDLTVIILTYNEEIHIERAIRSVMPLTKTILVVDSFSTDRTVEIAQSLGATVLQNKFVNYARQFQWGLDHAPGQDGWIMRLDADEVLEPELIDELTENLSRLPDEVVGINLKRRHVFMGRWIRHGGRYPLILLRLFRRGKGRIENRWMDEHLVVWGGETITLKHDFSDVNLNDLTFFTDKHNKYATREALDVLITKYRLDDTIETLSIGSGSAQASLKRLIKEGFYNKLPFWMGPLGYFLYRYFIQLGFLDGGPGIIYHCLQGFWYRFLVAAKIVELEDGLRGLTDAGERRTRLEQLTGHKIGNVTD